MRDEDYFTLRLFAEALGGGMSSRLFQEAREKRGLAYSIDAWADTYAETGLLGVYAGAAPGDTAELAKVVAGELQELAGRIGDEELERCKAQLTAHLFMARESPLNRAEQAAGQVLLFGRLIAPADLAQGVEAVTRSDVARLGTRLLAPRASAAAVLGPKPSLAAAEGFRRALGAEAA